MDQRTEHLTREQESEIAEIVRKVVSDHRAVRLVLGGGESVLILPFGDLTPLPELDGAVPEGWKDAVYR
jgi:hypothetical protein